MVSDRAVAFFQESQKFERFLDLWSYNVTRKPTSTYAYFPITKEGKLEWYEATFKDVDEWTDKEAAYFKSKLVSKSESGASLNRNNPVLSNVDTSRVVAVWVETSFNALTFTYSMFKLDKLPFLIAQMIPSSVAITLLAEIRPKHLAYSSIFKERAIEVGKTYPDMELIELPSNPFFFRDLSLEYNERPWEKRNSDDVFAIAHSSAGSSLVPKLVPLNSKRMIRATVLVFDVENPPERRGERPFFLVLPASSGATIQGGYINPLLFGEPIAFPRSTIWPPSEKQAFDDLIELNSYQYYSTPGHFYDMLQFALRPGNDKYLKFLQQLDYFLIGGRIRDDVGQLAKKNRVLIKLVGGCCETNSLFGSDLSNNQYWEHLKPLPTIKYRLEPCKGSEFLEFILDQSDPDTRLINHTGFLDDRQEYHIGDIYLPAADPELAKRGFLKYYGRVNDLTSFRSQVFNPNWVEYTMEQCEQVHESMIVLNENATELALLVVLRPTVDRYNLNLEALKRELSDLSATVGYLIEASRIEILPPGKYLPRNLKGLFSRPKVYNDPEWTTLTAEIFARS